MDQLFQRPPSAVHLDEDRAALDLEEFWPELFHRWRTRDSNRFKLNLTASNLLAAIGTIAGEPHCTFGLLQPGPTEDRWDLRSVPVAGFLVKDSKVIAQVSAGRAYKNSQLTPAVFPDLKGYEHPPIRRKLAAWSRAPYALTIAKARAAECPMYEQDAHWRIYRF